MGCHDIYAASRARDAQPEYEWEVELWVSGPLSAYNNVFVGTFIIYIMNKWHRRFQRGLEVLCHYPFPVYKYMYNWFHWH